MVYLRQAATVAPMTFQLSQRSRTNLVGVHHKLVVVVERAIELTKVDFAVTEGVRTLARQRQLVSQGASQTMDSKHIKGEAVDLVAFLGSRISWELSLYDDIADAMRQAAREHAVALRWGAAWNIPNITAWKGTMEGAMNHYIDERRRAGRRPFIDAPHFELS
jgi:peptidoglycan LD-endopeptidase CwlK